MIDANVKLSKTEMLMVCNAEFILTKNSIIKKANQLFGLVSNNVSKQVENIKDIFPKEVLKWSPKIYNGEQYKSLPYVMLDHPRYFVKDDVFSVRCFFWWGNFFSIALHMGGIYATNYASLVLRALNENELSQWFICVNESPWEHYFEANNYQPKDHDTIRHLSEPIIKQKSFFKIAKKIPLQQWDDAYDFFVDNYQEIFRMIKPLDL